MALQLPEGLVDLRSPDGAAMLAAQEEIAARLLSAELELISATSADVSDPPPPPGPTAE